MDVPLSVSYNGLVKLNHLNRLVNGTTTAISAYVQSQTGQSSSRKYYDHESNSSFSKPSIV